MNKEAIIGDAILRFLGSPVKSKFMKGVVRKLLNRKVLDRTAKKMYEYPLPPRAAQAVGSFPKWNTALKYSIDPTRARTLTAINKYPSLTAKGLGSLVAAGGGIGLGSLANKGIDEVKKQAPWGDSGIRKEY